MHIAKHTVHIEVEIIIGFHFDGFRIVNFVPQTALYRSTNRFSLIIIRSIVHLPVFESRNGISYKLRLGKGLRLQYTAVI